MSSVLGPNSYGFLFDSLPYRSDSTGLSNFFSSGSNLLGDYSMIKSGAYKKLLTAYYKTQDSSDAKSSSSTKSTSKSDTENAKSNSKLMGVKSDADQLTNALDKLDNKALYASTGVDSEGKKTYNTSGIKSAVKDFVSSYNSFLSSASSVDSTNILKKAASMVKTTSHNKELLKDVGITIGSDNKLSLDETKLDSASKTTLSELFADSFSYGDTVSQRAEESANIANSSAHNNSHASSYTFNGSYSNLGNTSSVLDKYL